MDTRRPASPIGPDDPTVVLSPEQKRVLYQRRSALLSGLIVPGQPAQALPGVAELVAHREQLQARRTMELAAFIQQAEAAPPDAAQPHQPEAPPKPPGAPAPEPPKPPAPAAAKPSRWRRLLARLRPRLPGDDLELLRAQDQRV